MININEKLQTSNLTDIRNQFFFKSDKKIVLVRSMCVVLISDIFVLGLSDCIETLNTRSSNQ
jgi:hypothetical protein